MKRCLHPIKSRGASTVFFCPGTKAEGLSVLTRRFFSLGVLLYSLRRKNRRFHQNATVPFSQSRETAREAGDKRAAGKHMKSNKPRPQPSNCDRGLLLVDFRLIWRESLHVLSEREGTPFGAAPDRGKSSLRQMIPVPHVAKIRFHFTGIRPPGE